MRRTWLITIIAALLIPLPVAAGAAPPAGARIDLKILLVSRGDAPTTAIAAQLTAEGVPFDTVAVDDPNRPTLDAAFLSDEVDGLPRARYQAVVLPDAAPFTNPAEATALADYERRFGIPQVDAFVWPSSLVGLQSPTFAGMLDGIGATVTDAGRAGAFSYLRGPVPFEDNDAAVWESYGYLAQPATGPGGTFEPLLVAPIPAEAGGGTGVLAGEYRVDGRRELVLTFAYNAYQQQFAMLGHGIVRWLTGGLYLGHYRNYFAVHVDDVLVADTRWSIIGNCTPGDDCTAPYQTTDIRLTPADVTYAVAWQESHGFALDLLFNAAGSVEVSTDTGRPDPLTERLLADRAAFRWSNHTYSHAFLGCVQDFTVVPWRCATAPGTGAVEYATQAAIQQEIDANLAWATANGLSVDPSGLVTGEHSGLRILPQQPVDNPNLAPAVAATGVAWLGGDDSRDHGQRPVGPALTVPRHPMNVFYNVATAAEEVDEYNWIYTGRAAGGSGICEDHPQTTTCIQPLDPTSGYAGVIVPLEARIALSHVLANDPRPHYIHQSNLAEGRIAYPLLDRVLSDYRAAFAANTPLVSPSLADSGATLRRQDAWRSTAGAVSAYVRDGVVTVQAPAGVDVPLTVPTGTRVGDASGPAFGSPYGGLSSGYQRADGTATVLVLP